MRARTLACLSHLVWLAGCAPPEQVPPPPAKPVDYVACSEPRPQICTREYRPVCARVDNGKRCVTTPCDSSVEETRATACTACSDPKVMGYRAGACEADKRAP